MLINDWAQKCNSLSNSAGLTSFLLNITPDAKVKAQSLKEWHDAQHEGGKVRIQMLFQIESETVILAVHLENVSELFQFIPIKVMFCIRYLV